MIDEKTIKKCAAIDARFDFNDTMRLLKNQNIAEMIGSKEIKGMREILEAHNVENPMEIAFDIFMLGYIYGKESGKVD